MNRPHILLSRKSGREEKRQLKVRAKVENLCNYVMQLCELIKGSRAKSRGINERASGGETAFQYTSTFLFIYHFGLWSAPAASCEFD